MLFILFCFYPYPIQYNAKIHEKYDEKNINTTYLLFPQFHYR